MSTAHVTEIILDIAPIWFSWHCDIVTEFMCERGYSQSISKLNQLWKNVLFRSLIHKKTETFPHQFWQKQSYLFWQAWIHEFKTVSALKIGSAHLIKLHTVHYGQDRCMRTSNLWLHQKKGMKRGLITKQNHPIHPTKHEQEFILVVFSNHNIKDTKWRSIFFLSFLLWRFSSKTKLCSALGYTT